MEKETIKMDALVGRTDKNGIYRMKNIGTAFVNETNIKVLLDALPMPNTNGQAIIYLKERSLADVQKENEQG